jgi:Zn-dependent protease
MPLAFLVSPWGGVFWLVAVISTVTFHEFFHALVAYGLGDQTPKAEGRVTLFPFPHIDPLGLVLILLFGIGWAKPVRFEPSSLRYPNFGSTAVALAGPLANLILLVITALAAKILIFYTGAPLSLQVSVLFQSFVVINSLFFVVNLIPLPPFDGSKFLLDLLQKLHFQAANDFLIKNGQYIVVGLLAVDALAGFGVVARFVGQVTSWFTQFVITVS